MISKKIFSLITVACLSMTLLVGCKSAPVETEESVPSPKNIVGLEVPVEGSNETIVVEATYENDIPVDINIDVKLEDGKMKSELSSNGEYVMNPEAEYLWHEQIDLLEKTIKENNFDISKIVVDDNGKTDAISGVSISVSSYLDAVKQLLQ